MRADKYFAGVFLSRTKAAAALKKGLVLLNGRALKPDDEVRGDEAFTFLPQEEAFVSQGGYKLARGLDAFHESVEGCTFADLGASTGGFCDCLLQRGARRVYCVDVGENQLDSRIATDERVTVMDKTNARYLTKESFPEKIDGVVSDLSFISLKLVLPAIENVLPQEGRAFVLFKPQFECEGKGLGKSGILPKSRHAALLKSFYSFACGFNLVPQNIVNAPLREKKNVEYVLFLKKGARAIPEAEFLTRAADLYETIKIR